MAFEASSQVGAAFQYDDDGIPERQVHALAIDEQDVELLSCYLCSSHLYAGIGIPLHVGADGHLYCDSVCEQEMVTLQCIVAGADALIERVSEKEVAHA